MVSVRGGGADKDKCGKVDKNCVEFSCCLFLFYLKFGRKYIILISMLYMINYNRTVDYFDTIHKINTPMLKYGLLHHGIPILLIWQEG